MGLYVRKIQLTKMIPINQTEDSPSVPTWIHQGYSLRVTYEFRITINSWVSSLYRSAVVLHKACMRSSAAARHIVVEKESVDMNYSRA